MLRIAIVFLALCAGAFAADADASWQALTALDAGPQQKPKTPAEVRSIPLEHAAKQEAAARAFLRDFPGDFRGVEARLRLARALQLRAEMQDAPVASPEVEKLLREAGKLAKPEQRVDVEFARLSYNMRLLSKATQQQKQHVLDLTRSFQHAHPDDRRLAPLLVEVATLFDLQPRTKQALLIDARRASSDEELNERIGDDLRRIGLLGQSFDLKFAAADGTVIDIADHRGKTVLLVFFAAWSPPGVEAVDALQKAAAILPADKVQLFGVSLDTQREPLEGFVASRKIDWPVICDGKSWDSPLVRSLGINTLPTVWIVDAQGRLRSLNGLEQTLPQVREILKQMPARQ